MAAQQQPSIQGGQILKMNLGRKQPLTNMLDLVLNLSLAIVLGPMADKGSF